MPSQYNVSLKHEEQWEIDSQLRTPRNGPVAMVVNRSENGEVMDILIFVIESNGERKLVKLTPPADGVTPPEDDYGPFYDIEHERHFYILKKIESIRDVHTWFLRNFTREMTPDEAKIINLKSNKHK